MHAPLLDPGGVPSTRQSASGTAAFQCLETVGFPPRYTFRGSITRPASSLPPAPYSHCWVCTWRLLLTCWLDFSQGGLALRSAHLLGNINQFHRIAPIPKVSGLPWRDQAHVRREKRRRSLRYTVVSPLVEHGQQFSGLYGFTHIVVHTCI